LEALPVYFDRVARHMAASALLSDLHGVTVRNTFLEFEDVSTDPFQTSGFMRQTSEPANAFYRQASEQTTAGSGGTLEESTTEPDENHSNLTACLRAGLPPACQLQPSVTKVKGPLAADVASVSFQGLQAAPASVPDPNQGFPSQILVPRFCPNCGARSERWHRFCPYCRYQLQPMGAGFTSEGGCNTMAAPAVPAPSTGPQSCGAPNLLSHIRRLRYIEACSEDIELVQLACQAYLRGEEGCAAAERKPNWSSGGTNTGRSRGGSGQDQRMSFGRGKSRS